MGLERLTDRAHKVMQLANQEAHRFYHEYLGTEHILLGLVKEGSGMAISVLKNLDIDLRKVWLEVEKIVQTGPDMVIKGTLPHAPRARSVIEYSIAEAQILNHHHVGTEHLLLGLLRQQDGVAAKVLMNLGLTLEAAIEEVVRQFGSPGVDADEADTRRMVYQAADPDPTELQYWPEEAIRAMNEIKDQIEIVQGREESAVAGQDVEWAAYLRDQAEMLFRKRTSIIRLWRFRIRLVFEIRDGGSASSAALAAAVLDGDWSVLPFLADALEDAEDPRSDRIRDWVEEGNDQGEAGR